VPDATSAAEALLGENMVKAVKANTEANFLVVIM
jgi:hypothetical protein